MPFLLAWPGNIGQTRFGIRDSSQDLQLDDGLPPCRVHASLYVPVFFWQGGETPL